MSEIYYPDSDMDQEEKDINNRIAELVEFKCWKKGSRCDGKLITRCGACGGYGHANCYGNGSGAIQFACCQERPNYTQNIEEAWKLIAELDQIDITLSLKDGYWYAKATRYGFNFSIWEADAEWAEMAICKLFLAVKESDNA